MGNAVRAAIVLSVFVVVLAVGCAGSIDIDLDETPDATDDDPPASNWTIVLLAAYFAAVPLALIWFLVLIAYLIRRVKNARRDDSGLPG